MEFEKDVVRKVGFVAIDASDFQTAIPTLTYDRVTCKVQKAGASSLTPKTITTVNFGNRGDGLYEVEFSASDMDTEGTLHSLFLSTYNMLSYYREDEVSISLPGDGPGGFAITITLEDAVSVPIPDAVVQIRNSAGTLVVARLNTSVSGTAVFFLPAATYKVYLFSYGHSFSGNPYTIVVIANASIAYEGAVFAPADPGTPSTVSVYGWLTDAKGVALSGVVIKFMPLIQGSGNQTVGMSQSEDGKLLAVREQSVTTDVDGYFSIPLVPNENITPVSTKYQVTFSTGEQSYITVPATGPVDISTLL